MMIYKCPCCKLKSVMWDPRSRHFLCHNNKCAVSIPPPPANSPIEEQAIINNLSSNLTPVTTELLEESYQQCQTLA